MIGTTGNALQEGDETYTLTITRSRAVAVGGYEHVGGYVGGGGGDFCGPRVRKCAAVALGVTAVGLSLFFGISRAMCTTPWMEWPTCTNGTAGNLCNYDLQACSETSSCGYHIPTGCECAGVDGCEWVNCALVNVCQWCGFYSQSVCLSPNPWRPGNA